MFTDDATRYSWEKRLNTKADITTPFLDVHTMIERTHGATIRRYRFDNEFLQRKLITFVQSKGISVEPTVPFGHWMNGVAERGMRTERDKASAMLGEHIVSKRITTIIRYRAEEDLRQSSISERLWPEA